jgi:hypothetical protein
VRLRSELEEHALHLQALRARASEADIRLGLRDQVAFHSSGITDEDIQAAIGITQSILLGIIGSKI